MLILPAMLSQCREMCGLSYASVETLHGLKRVRTYFAANFTHDGEHRSFVMLRGGIPCHRIESSMRQLVNFCGMIIYQRLEDVSFARCERSMNRSCNYREDDDRRAKQSHSKRMLLLVRRRFSCGVNVDFVSF